MNFHRTLYILAIFGTIAVFLAGCHGPRHGDKYFPSRLLEHVDDHVEDLNLTEEQNGKYLDIRARLEADLIKQRDAHKEFRTELIEVIDNQENGVKEITTKVRTKTGDIPSMVNLYLDYVDEFYEILDEQQQAIVMEEIRDKAESRRFRR